MERKNRSRNLRLPPHSLSRRIGKLGLKKKVIDIIIKHKETLLESWKEKGSWGNHKGHRPEAGEK